MDSAFFDLSLPGIPFSKDVYSAAKCQELCQKHEKCNYFVHDRRDGQRNWCWLKTAAKDKKSVDGTTLGPKYCDGYSAPGDTYQEPTHSIQAPSSNYEEPEDNYQEPDPNYEEPPPISPRGAKKISGGIHFPEPGA